MLCSLSTMEATTLGDDLGFWSVTGCWLGQSAAQHSVVANP